MYNLYMKNNILKTERNVHFFCCYNLIWCTYYKRKILKGDIAKSLKEVIENKCNELNVEIILLAIHENYVQLKANIPPDIGPYKCIKQIKMASGKKLREEYPEIETKLTNLWTSAYLVKTEGEAIEDDEIEMFLSKQKTN